MTTEQDKCQLCLRTGQKMQYRQGKRYCMTCIAIRRREKQKAEREQDTGARRFLEALLGGNVD